MDGNITSQSEFVSVEHDETLRNICVFSNQVSDFALTLTLPYPTKSNKQVFLLAHARSVFDDVINEIHILGAIIAPRSG